MAIVLDGTTGISASGNITVGGTLSAGTFSPSSFSAPGNVTGGNLLTSGLVSADGNVVGGNIISTNAVSAGGNVVGGNLVTLGAVNTATVTASSTINATGNITGGNVAAVGEIFGATVSATGNVSGGNLTISGALTGDSLSITADAVIGGNLQVDGNLAYVNVDTLNVEDPIIGLGRGPNNDPLTTDDGMDRGTQLWYFDGEERSAFLGYNNATGNIIAALDVTIVNEQVTVENWGNFVVGDVYAEDIAAVGMISAGNIEATHSVAAAVISASGNITAGNVVTLGTADVGALVSSSTISASGNVTGGNIVSVNDVTTDTVNATGAISAVGNITGNYFIGNGSQLTGIDATSIQNGTSNVRTYLDGDVAVSVAGTANVAVYDSTGVVVTGTSSATGNITGGNLVTAGDVTTATVNATGNITGGNIVTAGDVTTATVNATGNITGGNVSTAGLITTTGNITGGNLVTAGDVTTTTVNATGNITGGNLVTAGDVTTTTVNATGNVSGGNLVTAGDVTTATVNATGNITGGNIVTAGDVTTATVNATGNVSGGNIVTAGQVAADNMTATANITGGNVNTAGFVSATGNVDGGNINTAGLITATGNVTGGNVNTAGLITGGNINTAGLITATGNVTGGNINTAGLITATGNVNGGNVNTAGLVSAGGNITGGNLNTAGIVSATGNVTGGNLTTSGDVDTATVTASSTVSAAGNVTGGNLLTAGVLSVTGTGVSAFSGNVDLNSKNILNVADPVNATDAANKQYVDEVAEGLRARPSVYLATTVNLDATYDNGTAGVGATLTANANGQFPLVDGEQANTTPGFNGVLVKNQSNAAHNGRYNVTTLGDGSTPWVLTRCGLCDEADEIPGSYTFVLDGDTQAGTGWVQTVADPATFVVGTDAIIVVQFSGAGTYTAGTGLTLTGNEFSVNASQTQITALGTLGSLSATGNIDGGNVSGTRGAFTNIAGTLETAAQTNITSVGTLSSLSVTGNVTGGNLITSGAVTGNGRALTSLNATNLDTGTIDAARLSGTYTITVSGAATTAGTVTTNAQPNITSVGTLSSLSVTGNVTGGNLITAGLVSVSSIAKTGSNGVGNIGGSTSTFDTVFAKATSAQYADVAEYYVADRIYEPGTVLEFGGEKEVTQTTADHVTTIAGVVSSNPAVIMNSGLDHADRVLVALLGRVPCRVKGPVSRGDRLVASDVPGVAQRLDPARYEPGSIIGKALDGCDDGQQRIIEVVVGRL